ncbi:MAG: hypothetical protein FJ302_13355 [Planctomycetes bacterium]|nr:hypothetical protein [Planctomycetota bacterium]
MTDELRVARDVMDEIREDIGWVTRNGIPGHRDGPSQLLRMARDPLAADASERLEVRLNQGAATDSPAFSPEKFDELLLEIAEVVTVVGQEQLNLLLTALDSARDRLLTAIKSPAADPKSKAKSSEAQHRSQPATPPKPAGRGRLF